ncbi:MAG: hypothetical protein J5769_06145 [Bacteroidales bacterium]|nr:hypothetical protein [Bacteroidales bacterium]
MNSLILLGAMLFLHGSFTAAAEESAPRYVSQNIYLYVDSNASESSSSFDAAGGREIFFVDTNAPEYSVTGLPSWCVLENKSRTSFLIVYESNSGAARSFTFHVTAGPKTVKVTITQAETNGVELSSVGWVAALDKVLTNVTKTYRNADGNSDRFKGELNSQGKRHGFGIYKWYEGSCYLGEYENGTRSGSGIYLVGGSNFQFGACEGCMVYVGGYSGGKASGEGTCYDEYGRAIYRGRFSAGSPSDLYPGKGNYSDYRFEWLPVDGGVYFGETVKGVPGGLGIFLADNGDAWFGYYRNGNRMSGIDLQYSSGKVRRPE